MSGAPIVLAFACALLSSAFTGSIVYLFGKNVDTILRLTTVFGGNYDVGSRMVRWVTSDTPPGGIERYHPGAEGAEDYDPFWWMDPDTPLFWNPDGSVSRRPNPGSVPIRPPRRWFEYEIPNWIRAQGGGIIRTLRMPNLGTTGLFLEQRGPGRYHNGVDWSMVTGTPIYGFHAGPAMVLFTGYMPNGYGHYVVVSDGVHVMLYAHLSRIDVQAGQIVHPDTQLGLSGSTGNSTGGHLHFELISEGGYLDPCQYIDCPPYRPPRS